MKKSPLFIVLIVSLFTLVVNLACESDNQEPSPTAPGVADAALSKTSHGGKPLFKEDFSSGLGQWTLESPSYWSTPNGVLDVNIPSVSYTFARAIAGDENWTNYRFDFDVEGLVGSEKICYVRYHDETQGYMLNFRSAVPAEGDPGAVRLFRLNDQPYQSWGSRGARGGWDLLTAVPYLHHQGSWYHVTVSVAGPNITVSIDGAQVIDYVDTDAPVLTGRIGLAGFTGANFEGGQHVQFDNVQVRCYPGRH